MQFDIRKFDIYRKIPKDLTQPTNTGAFISISCIVFIAFLLLSELFAYIMPEVNSQLFVHNISGNKNVDGGKIPVTLDISVYEVQCRFLGLDIQDDLGRHEVGFIDNTVKTDINDGKGCRMKTLFRINKVPGNFHVSTHASHEQPVDVNMGHHIHDLTIGEHVEVPTIYEDVHRRFVYPYQFTYAHREYSPYAHGGFKVPATIWFRYDLNPITVKYTEKRKPFYTFLTTVCAIVGGTFTVAGILDSLIFTASETFKKFQAGKLG